MQILCDTHAHTVASTHAYSTVHDYIRDAKRHGLQLFALTDHAPEMPDGAHLWHFGNMKVLPRIVDEIAILRAIEANILPQPYRDTGRYVDVPDRLLPYLDFAIASLHEPVFPPGSKSENTRAMIRAMESGVVQIIGHPGNPNYPIDQDEVVRAAKANNVLLEINNSSFELSRPGSAPFCAALLEVIEKHDWKISVASDSHVSFSIGRFPAVTALLEATNFSADRIVSLTPQRFLGFLAEHDKTVSAELQSWLSNL